MGSMNTRCPRAECFEIEDATRAIIGNSAALQRVLGLVRDRSPDRRHCVDPRGNRNWQGTDCGSHSQVQRPIEAAHL